MALKVKVRQDETLHVAHCPALPLLQEAQSLEGGEEMG